MRTILLPLAAAFLFCFTNEAFAYNFSDSFPEKDNNHLAVNEIERHYENDHLSVEPPDNLGNHQKSPNYYYVDGSVASSGDGISWATAWKTIAEANNYDLQPGNTVWIKNGTYIEGFYPSKSGAEVVSIKTGVEINDGKIIFPVGTDLTGVDIASHPGEFYVYVYRSWRSNNGVFQITEVNVAERYVRVANPSFINETGTAGDAKFLSASIGRPIVFRNGADDPENDRVALDVSSTNINTVAYMAIKNYLIIDGIDLTGSKNYGGWHIVSSNHNVIMNCRIYDMGTVSQYGAPGILIEGNTTTGAGNYNIIMNNEIFNTPYEGVYIGKGGGNAAQNHTHYNHVIGNRIYTSGSAGHAKMENAIDFKEYNIGNVAERNVIGPYKLSTTWNGAIDIVHHATSILVYNNVFQNVIRGDENDYYYVIGVNNDASQNYIFNNIIYNESLGTGLLYGMSIKSTNLANSYIAHNTIYNLPYGLLLDNSTGNSTTIANNIIQCTNSITNWSSNNLTLRNNLYLTTPGSYGSEPGRQVGNARFLAPQNGDFRVSSTSLAVNNGSTTLPNMGFDFNLTARSSTPTIGAFEFDPAFANAWTGASSTDWNTTSNWSAVAIPDQTAGVLIPANCPLYPVVSNAPANPATVSDITIEEGATLTIAPAGCLTVSGNFANHAGASAFTIQSNASSTGSLIHNSAGVEATVQRYITGGWGSWDAGWHQLSSPVAAQPISDFTTSGAGNDYDFYGWYEATNYWMNFKDPSFTGWNGGENFVPGRGYFASYEQNQSNLAFAGELNVENIVFQNLSYNTNQGKGWHLLGNPFASAIKWNDGNWNLDDIAGTAKIWSESGKSYTDINADGIIPAAQGFFVHAGSISNSLTIPAASRLHNATPWHKNSDLKRILLVAAPIDGSSHQETVILLNPAATNGYDFYYDSPFMAGYAPQFFSLINQTRLSTNALPVLSATNPISLGFVINDHQDYTIEMRENTTGENLFLFDLKLGVEHDLSKNTVYHFSSVEGDEPGRFLLSKSAVGISQAQVQDGFRVLVQGNEVNIISSLPINGEFAVYNLAGQQILHGGMNETAHTKTVTLNNPSSWYIIQIKTDRGVYSQMFFLK
jgi:hypothetical protein